jgi:aminocarboxymuconate-semialdehyde decarboxylase
VFTAHQLVGLIEAFGADTVLIGTDYPFDMAEADPSGHLATVPALPDATLTDRGRERQEPIGI